jgi:uncharacterized membrane protein YhaH (DUF805 family)
MRERALLDMVDDYFGSVISGRLRTQRFIILWFVLMIAFVVLGFLIGVSIGIAERLTGGDLATAQKLLAETLGVPDIVAVLVIFVLLGFAKLNIIAKRARDIGMPGWLTAIILAGLVGGSTQAMGQDLQVASVCCFLSFWRSCRSVPGPERNN